MFFKCRAVHGGVFVPEGEPGQNECFLGKNRGLQHPYPEGFAAGLHPGLALCRISDWVPPSHRQKGHVPWQAHGSTGFEAWWLSGKTPQRLCSRGLPWSPSHSPHVPAEPHGTALLAAEPHSTVFPTGSWCCRHRWPRACQGPHWWAPSLLQATFFPWAPSAAGGLDGTPGKPASPPGKGFCLPRDRRLSRLWAFFP